MHWIISMKLNETQLNETQINETPFRYHGNCIDESVDWTVDDNPLDDLDFICKDCYTPRPGSTTSTLPTNTPAVEIDTAAEGEEEEEATATEKVVIIIHTSHLSSPIHGNVPILFAPLLLSPLLSHTLISN